MSRSGVGVAAVVGGLTWLAGAGLVRAETLGHSLPRDSRVRSVVYDAAEVVRVDAVVGYHLHLQWADEERLVHWAAGHSAALEVGSEGPHVLLKPKQPTVATNLTLISTQRVYHIAYRAVRSVAELPAEAVVWSLRFEYPAIPSVPPPEPEMVSTPAVRNTAYRLCGSKSLQPRAVSDDGEHTVFAFPPGEDLPAVYAIDAQGEEQLVNFHVTGSDLIAHRVASRWVLRRGRASACVKAVRS